MCAHTHIQWQGAEGSPFQHQQADESLGPNSLKAELALLFFLPPLSFFFSLIFQTHHLKFEIFSQSHSDKQGIFVPTIH